MELAAEARPLDRRIVITALGIAQILAWGTSFYFPAVFAEPIVGETGWSLGVGVGGTSIGLLTAGLIVQALAPSAGALMIEARGSDATIGVLTLFALINVVLIGILWWLCRKSSIDG